MLKKKYVFIYLYLCNIIYKFVKTFKKYFMALSILNCFIKNLKANFSYMIPIFYYYYLLAFSIYSHWCSLELLITKSLNILFFYKYYLFSMRKHSCFFVSISNIWKCSFYFLQCYKYFFLVHKKYSNFIFRRKRCFNLNFIVVDNFFFFSSSYYYLATTKKNC